ncbi:MAG TPA: hypothetical protein VLH16_06185 [Bacteroidales bacterium]|nr:hypothetical protein [Bacteroidales bacterium]
MRLVRLWIPFALALLPTLTNAQGLGNYLGDEAVLYAHTKQVNQFFRRFNGEENIRGQRFRENDELFRDQNLRIRYLSGLFDLENPLLPPGLRREFIADVTNPEKPNFLDFHGKGWMAEVNTRFNFMGNEQSLTLFLKLEQEHLGHKWVMTNVFFEPFNKLFVEPGDGKMRFLHPLSHELDFMNLIRVFRDRGHLTEYAPREYKPDFLSIFLYEVKRGNLNFITVTNVKFHFFQVSGWYFELSEIRRRGPNAGWLITSLVRITDEEKERLLQFILHE